MFQTEIDDSENSSDDVFDDTSAVKMKGLAIDIATVTIVFVGISGVGKSTMINELAYTDRICGKVTYSILT